jgi:hypothetical protein
MKKLTTLSALTFLFVILGIQVMPLVAHAESIILVDCKYGQDGNGNPKIQVKNPDGSSRGVEIECGFLDAIAQVKKLINFGFILALPVVVVAIALSGIRILLAQGNSGELTKAKQLLQKILIGFMFVLGAWLIVYTISSYLLRPEFYNVFLGDPNAPEQIK